MSAKVLTASVLAVVGSSVCIRYSHGQVIPLDSAKWRFVVVAQDTPFGGFTSFAGSEPAVDEDGSVACVAGHDSAANRAIVRFRSADRNTSTIVNQPPLLFNARLFEIDFLNGEIIASNYSTATTGAHYLLRVFSADDGAMLREYIPDGPLDLGNSFKPHFAFDGRIGYTSELNQVRYLVESPVPSGQPRSQALIAETGMQFGILPRPAISRNMFFAASVTDRSDPDDFDYFTYRWSQSSGLPTTVFEVAGPNEHATMSVNSSGQVLFLTRDGTRIDLRTSTSTGTDILGTADSSNPSSVFDVALWASFLPPTAGNTTFRGKINDAGYAVFLADGRGAGGALNRAIYLTNGASPAIRLVGQGDQVKVNGTTLAIGGTSGGASGSVFSVAMNSRGDIAFPVKLEDNTEAIVLGIPCPADFNRDGFRDPDDLADFITCFFLDVQIPGFCPSADFNWDQFRDPDDLADFITEFFLDC